MNVTFRVPPDVWRAGPSSARRSAEPLKGEAVAHVAREAMTARPVSGGAPPCGRSTPRLGLLPALRGVAHRQGPARESLTEGQHCQHTASSAAAVARDYCQRATRIRACCRQSPANRGRGGADQLRIDAGDSSRRRRIANRTDTGAAPSFETREERSAREQKAAAMIVGLMRPQDDRPSRWRSKVCVSCNIDDTDAAADLLQGGRKNRCFATETLRARFSATSRS
jgi:hypothetical protein